MKWEKLPFKCLKQYYTNPIEKLQDLQQPLRGMEMAITTAKISHPTNFQHNDFKQALHGLEQHITSLIKQHKTCESSSTVPKSNTRNMTKPLQTLQSIPTSTQHLSSFFFLFCFKLLHNKSLPKPSLPHKSLSTTTNTNSSSKQDELSSKWAWPINTKRLIHSLKSSLALGLSVLFGLLYSKENGFWSALPVAISYAAVREATFKVANIKAQGTVIGTVYGVIGCFLFEKYLPIRFLSLLPWFIFTSFLRRSRMYGPAGGISAVIGAVLILGRKNFGPPSDFAIARIVETFIGLSCSIMIDLVFQPTRASTLAKAHLCKSLGSLSECIGSIGLGIGPQVQINQAQFVKSLKRLKSDVIELGKYIEEADVEPNFWFLPFNSECYHKLLVSLNKIVDMLGFVNESMSLIEDELKENLSKLDGDFEHLKEIIGLCIKCYENVSLVKSIDVLDDQLEKKKVSFDVELGKSNWVSELDEEKIVSEFLQHADEVVGKMEVVKSDVVLGLSGLGFCMESLLKETKQIGDAIKEVVQWENPSKNINLVEISCKVQALYNNDN